MGFGREARRVRDEHLPHGQRLRALAHCLEWAQPISFHPSWVYLEAALDVPRESLDFLVLALDLLECERRLHLDLDVRCAALRRRQKRQGSSCPNPDEATPRFPQRWHGDEREVAAHPLRWWLQRDPMEDFVDHPQARLAVDAARVLASGPSLTSFDLAGLQASLDWARAETRTEASPTMAERRRGHQVLHLLGQIHIVLNGAPPVGLPWNFTGAPDELACRATVARTCLSAPG